VNHWANSVAALGSHFGLPGFQLNVRACAALQLESGKRVGFEAKQHELIVYASEPVPYDAYFRLTRAWRKSHFMQLRGAAPVQVALREQDGLNRLLVVARVLPRDGLAQDLSSVVEYLLGWLDATRND
jgi:hypothetical protein